MTIVQVIIPVMIVVFLAIAPPVAHHQFNATCPPFRELRGRTQCGAAHTGGRRAYFVRADFGATIAADPAALRLVEAAADRSAPHLAPRRVRPAAARLAAGWTPRAAGQGE